MIFGKGERRRTIRTSSENLTKSAKIAAFWQCSFYSWPALERGEDTNRLHFHGIFYVPDGKMIGKLAEVKDYDTRNHRMQTTYQNTHFLKQFGRNDFKDIATQDDISEAAKYITKYMEKSGERLVYGGKLPTYFHSDVLDEDVICAFGVDDRKVLLFDNFTCISEGEILGKVNKEIIAQLPHCN